MTTTVASFDIKFDADFAQFHQQLLAAQGNLKTATINIGNFGAGIASLPSLAAQAAAAIGVATTLLVTNSARQAVEIEKMSTIAQVGIEEIQSLGYASDKVGIPMDKMADILKDVNDKLGEYTNAGTGGFSDFFEQVAPKIGLTADELSHLSSSDVLIAVKKAMDDANVPMKEQIFHLEAIANDSSALIPLLANQGKELKNLETHYESLNVAMSEYDIQMFKEMDQQIGDLSLKIQRSFANAVVGSSDQLNWLTDKLTKTVDWWGTLFDSWKEKPSTEDGIIKRMLEIEHDANAAHSAISRAEKQLAELEKQASKPVTSYLSSDYNTNSNIDKQIELVKNNLAKQKALHKQHLKELDDLQQQYNDKLGVATGAPVDKPKPEIIGTEYDKDNITKISSLDAQYADELQKLKISHTQKLEQISKLTLSEYELNKRGFDSIAELRKYYTDKENTDYQKKISELSAKKSKELETEQTANFTKLALLQSRYADEFDLLQAANRQQLAEIEKLNLSQEEVEKEGFKSLSSMKAQLRDQENSFYQQQLAELTQKEIADTDLKFSRLQNTFATELEQLELSHQERLNEIENFKISELEAERLGYESLAALKDEFRQREADAHAKSIKEYNDREQQKLNQQLATEKRIDDQILASKYGVAADSLALIEQTAEEGSVLQQAAFIAQKAIAAKEILIQGEVAAAVALAELGPVAGLAQASVIRGLSYASAALVMAQSIAGMAHDGIAEIPQEGTWLLNKGERVYTNDSVEKLDHMYSIISSLTLQNSGFKANYENISNTGINQDGTSGWQIIINEAPTGTHADVDDERKVITIMMKDANSNGQYMSYLSSKLGTKSGGYK